MKDADLIIKDTNAVDHTHHDIKEIEFYCDGRHVRITLDDLRANFRKARTAGIVAEQEALSEEINLKLAQDFRVKCIDAAEREPRL